MIGGNINELKLLLSYHHSIEFESKIQCKEFHLKAQYNKINWILRYSLMSGVDFEEIWLFLYFIRLRVTDCKAEYFFVIAL
jgi:hypothetical protein